MQMLKSKRDVVRSEAEWRADLDAFWQWVDKQNNAIMSYRKLEGEPTEKMQKRLFKRPADAWEREIKLLGLEPVSSVSWKGVFGGD